MKKFYKSLCVTLALALIAGNSIAQSSNLCNTDEMVQRSLENNPHLKQGFLAEQLRLQAIDLKEAATEYKKVGPNQTMATVYIIPIVFHVIHQNGAENISDAQIIDAVRILNNDYRKRNADTSAIVNSFKAIAADCEIEFRLAQKDPSGNCTNGIDRIFSPLTNAADDNSKLNPWTAKRYLNVWTVKTIGSAGVAGYAYYPGSASAAVDGILILSNYIGSIGSSNPNTSRALTHEIGHYLNLAHTWGNTNQPGVACGSSDFVSDTPDTKGHQSCTLTDATCNAGVIENVQNYMEYAYCSNMFTAGQKTRMRAALVSNVGQRDTLWSAFNLFKTGVSTASVLCTADFKTINSVNTVCQGNSLTFNDISWNGTPTAWSWSFPGGTPSTSTDSVPVIQYNTPGTYDVTLTVSNASGSKTATKTGFVTVNSGTASYSGTTYSEGFEGSAIPNADWIVYNQSPGGNTWTQTSTAAATGSKSIKITNLSTYATYIDELVSPSINMAAISGTTPTMTFKVAYAQRTSTSADKLQVLVSTNCGLSWTIRKNLAGATLATGGVVTGSFTPTAAQWATQSVNLNGQASQPNLYIMFRFTSDGGNSIYIDDINISGTVTTGIEELANSIDFNIYPNPIEDNTVIAFNLLTKQNIDIKIMDVLGREVSTVFNGSLNEGEHQYAIGENSKLNAGIYFVKVTMDGKSFSKKMIVK